MRSLSGLVALAATFSSTLAAYQGFNYGSTFTSGAAKTQSDFEAEFKAAAGLVGAPAGGFTSARLYTMVQGGTASEPISAIPAAINTKTSLLLGMWASAGDAVFANELQALKATISKYGSNLGGLVAGISVGSEDLYRISPTGILNGENPGASPETIARYMKQVRDAISGTPLSGAPIGHVDTWTAWVNGSNQAVIDSCDWIGVDAYPYFQSTQSNAIENSKSLFEAAIGATKGAVNGKPVWVTETGFPVSGKTVGQAVPGLKNAQAYWNDVGCPMFGSVNVWWYTFQDAAPATPNPSFGVIGSQLTTTPLFDLSCKKVVIEPSSSSSLVVSSPSSQAGASSSGTTSSPAGNPTDVSGGSPGAGGGAGGGVPSSQLSLETSTVSSTASVPSGTGSGSGGSGSGSGITNTGSGTASSTPTNPTPVNQNGAGANSGSMGAAFAAMMAILVL
ncbi:glycoside hydrolase superfamily [Apodospora peruviana]|uniref:Probable glucan endo-1,3-beta-glucosidase eglC n=1 Tax=Apodospora peruviana TaxID=516989 RepID=A0AAE0M4E3_9PEZI|nr:glycoside hydrolase superfamily [Apodospora peruviana]